MIFQRRKEVDPMPFVDSNTHDQRLRAMPNPIAWVWDEVHPAGGPPNWDHQLYWPWENVRLLLTFVPSRMRSGPDRAVVLMYKPMHHCTSNLQMSIPLVFDHIICNA